MSRLLWSETHQRTYETGVDRGVLYIEDQPGIVWNGLVKIEETLPDQDVVSAYYDGQKFRSLVSNAAYSATISAYSAPSEFAMCEGLTELYPGFYATNQIRGMFAISFRTLIGDPLKGKNRGYKIHIVYNLMAFRATKVHKTIERDLNPDVKQWNCFARPYLRDENAYFRPKGTTYEEGVERQLFLHRPGSHYVVSSDSVTPQAMSDLEDILYGTDTFDASLPNPTMLADLIR